jgi:hypothetical protein
MFKTTGNKMTNDRALEMFQTGQGADFVIEVAPQIDGQEKKVFSCFYYCTPVFSCPGFFSICPVSVSVSKDRDRTD